MLMGREKNGLHAPCSMLPCSGASLCTAQPGRAVVERGPLWSQLARAWRANHGLPLPLAALSFLLPNPADASARGSQRATEPQSQRAKEPKRQSRGRELLQGPQTPFTSHLPRLVVACRQVVVLSPTVPLSIPSPAAPTSRCLALFSARLVLPPSSRYLHHSLHPFTTTLLS